VFRFFPHPRNAGAGVAGRPDLDRRRFYRDERGTPAREFLARLFAEADLPCEIDPAVTGFLSMEYKQGAGLREILATVTDGMSLARGPRLTYRVAGGTFLVYPLEREYGAESGRKEPDRK
jgi:hypothetical protein